jgi:hypothetical protein
MWMRVSISSAFLHPMTMGMANPISPLFGNTAEAFTAAGINFKKSIRQAVTVPPEIASP